MLTVFMWYFRTRGGGRDLNTAGRSFANKLHSHCLLLEPTNAIHSLADTHEKGFQQKTK
jgi:hypothetical protein